MENQVVASPASGGCLRTSVPAGFPVPHSEREPRVQHVEMQPPAALDTAHAEAKGGDTKVNIPRRLPFALSESNLLSVPSSMCHSPSLTSTPTTYSFSPMSPTSLNSSLQSASSIAGMSFCHSRNSSLDDAGLPFESPKSPPPLSAGALWHWHGLPRRDTSTPQPHRRMESCDWINWRQRMARIEGNEDDPRGCRSEGEEDDDLIAYRKESEAKAEGAPGSSVVTEAQPAQTATPSGPTTPVHHAGDGPGNMIGPRPNSVASSVAEDSPATPGEEPECPAEDTASLPWEMGADDNSPSHVEEDQPTRQEDILTRVILSEGFNLRLGQSAPPPGVVEAVQSCIDEITESLQRARGLGLIGATMTADSPGSVSAVVSETSSNRQFTGARKRAARGPVGKDDDLREEDSDEEGDADSMSQQDAGNRKKTKLDQYPCPFRKRNPQRFHCREWEYCAKAPFRGMTELKYEHEKPMIPSRLLIRLLSENISSSTTINRNSSFSASGVARDSP